MKHHLSFGFKKLTGGALIVVAQGVHDALVKNSGQFPGLPVSPAALQTGIDDFTNKFNAAFQGGVAQTQAKNAARAALLDLLDTLARHVEGVALGNADIIRAGGFELRKAGYSPQTPLTKPTNIRAVNVASTQVKLRVKAQRNVRSIKAQYRTAGGPWQDGGDFPNTRVVVVRHLMPGTVYDFRVQFFGGSTGATEWSDTLTHMAI